MQDVETAPVVGIHPFAVHLLPVPEFTASGPDGHLRAVQHHVVHRPDHPAQFDQCPAVQRTHQLGGRVRRPEPAEQHQVDIRRDSGGGIGVQHRQPTNDIEHVCRPSTVQQLGAHSDTPRLDTRELVDGHDSNTYHTDLDGGLTPAPARMIGRNARFATYSLP